MKQFKTLSAAALFAVAAVGSAYAHATDRAIVLKEGFEHVNDNMLVPPDLSLYGNTTLSSSTPEGFTVLDSIDGGDAYPDDWARVGTSSTADGPGLFAFRYLGGANTLNHIGIESMRAVTAVPEPSAYLMLGLGITAIGLARRKPAN
jgi:hypothetical protein